MIFGIGYNSKKLGHKAYKKNTPTKCYRCWQGMLERCYSKKHVKYKRYGGRGVKVCKQWHDYQNFAEFYHNNYFLGSQLDKDILGNGKLYSPYTCKFVSCQDNNEYSKAKKWIFISPHGKIVEIFNLSKFCRENKLCESSMNHVSKGKYKQHKGWSKPHQLNEILNKEQGE